MKGELLAVLPFEVGFFSRSAPWDSWENTCKNINIVKKEMNIVNIAKTWKKKKGRNKKVFLGARRGALGLKEGHGCCVRDPNGVVEDAATHAFSNLLPWTSIILIRFLSFLSVFIISLLSSFVPFHLLCLKRKLLNYHCVQLEFGQLERFSFWAPIFSLSIPSLIFFGHLELAPLGRKVLRNSLKRWSTSQISGLLRTIEPLLPSLKLLTVLFELLSFNSCTEEVCPTCGFTASALVRIESLKLEYCCHRPTLDMGSMHISSCSSWI